MAQLQNVIIVGASVRAAAESAATAGYDVHAFDLFADEDLARIASATQLTTNYPHGLISALDAAPSNAAWCYTGGIENYPELIAKVCQRRELLGNSAEVVKRVRDPSWLAEVAARAGWQVPNALSRPTPGGLRKPRQHCGGLRTRRLGASASPARDSFLDQEFVPGPLFGGLFLGEPALGQSRFVGATRQLTASDTSHHPLVDKHPFAYIGSEGPVEYDSADRSAWRALGRALAAATPLRGLFGVDAIKHATRGWVMLELNPRWTASVELLERAFSFSAFRYHVAACHGESTPPRLPASPPQNSFIKRVVYAAGRMAVDRSLRRKIARLRTAPGQISAHDLPRLGTTIEALHPLLTLIATDKNLATARKHLEEAVQCLLRAPTRRTGL